MFEQRLLDSIPAHLARGAPDDGDDDQTTLGAQVDAGVDGRAPLIPRISGATIVASWLWDSLLLALTLVAVAALVLIGALALGWNSPRRALPADWESPALPRRVEITADATYLSLLNRPTGDLVFEVIAVPLAGPVSDLYGHGLVYRAQDATHYYAFVVGVEGYYTVLKQDGSHVTALVPWQQFPHVRRGRQPNRLLVTCTGSSCAFRINDEHAATVEDDTWLSGDIGLWARSSDQAAALQFRSARLWLSGD